jgi:two-component system capsular synthesis response regulator RcsB
MTLRAVLADDHPLFLAGVEAVLQKHRLAHVVARADCSDALIGALETTCCDLVITDFSMPGGRHGDGLRLLGYLARHFPGVPVIVLTMHMNPGILGAIARQRIAGLIGKASVDGELAMAVRAAVQGRVHLSESVKTAIGLDNLMRIESLGSPGSLSPREAEILRLFAAGLSGDQIAARLQRSKKTVSGHKRSGMRKLGVITDADFFLYLRVRDDLLVGNDRSRP